MATSRPSREPKWYSSRPLPGMGPVERGRLLAPRRRLTARPRRDPVAALLTAGLPAPRHLGGADPGGRGGAAAVYTVVAGIPVRNYRADVTLTPDGDGTHIRWEASWDP